MANITSQVNGHTACLPINVNVGELKVRRTLYRTACTLSDQCEPRGSHHGGMLMLWTLGTHPDSHLLSRLRRGAD